MYMMYGSNRNIPTCTRLKNKKNKKYVNNFATDTIDTVVKSSTYVIIY